MVVRQLIEHLSVFLGCGVSLRCLKFWLWIDSDETIVMVGVYEGMGEFIQIGLGIREAIHNLIWWDAWVLVGRSLVLGRGRLRHGDVLEVLRCMIHEAVGVLLATSSGPTTMLSLMPFLASLWLGWVLILMNFLQVRLQLHATNQFNYNLKIRDNKKSVFKQKAKIQTSSF